MKHRMTIHDKGVLIGGLVMVLLLGTFKIAMGASVVLQASWDFTTQKIIWSHEEDGVLVFQDTTRDGRQSIDTAHNATDGKLHIWHYRSWEDSTGLPWSYFIYPDLNSNGAYLNQPACPITGNFWKLS